MSFAKNNIILNAITNHEQGFSIPLLWLFTALPLSPVGSNVFLTPSVHGLGTLVGI